MQAVLPVLQKFADWAQRNPQAFLAIAGAITAISVAILAVNFAMALNPFTAIAAGVAALVVGIIYAYNKFETFRTIIDAIFGAIKYQINNVTIPLFKALLGAATFVFEAIAAVWNNTVGKLAFTIPSWVPLLGGKSFAMPKIGGGGGASGGLTSARAFEESQKEIMAANPDVFSAPPSVAAAAPGKVQNSEPPVSAMPKGSGSNSMAGGLAGVDVGNFTFNIDAGLISSPATVGQDIIDAILAAQRNSGVVFAPAVTF